MKNLILLLAISSVTLFSFTIPNEESYYECSKISYNVDKSNGEVLVYFNLPNISDYEEIILLRSEDPVNYFRKVKSLSKEEINNLKETSFIQDKYPLSGSSTSYYKIQTIDKDGVQRAFPSVKL